MELLTYNQYYYNLKRTMDLGLISLLNKKQLEDLALKYFGIKDSNAQFIAYECPYSGKLINNCEEIVLEHIIPVDAKGGTILFNCIPTSKEVNGTNEKYTKHLISWWTNSKYWDNNAPKRLEKLVNYILEAYEIVFKEYKENDIQYNDMNFEFEENADLTTTSKKETFKRINEVEESQIYSYYVFLNDCIFCLEKNNIDTTFINNRLDKIINENIFENIEMYTAYQNILNDIIKNFLHLQDKSELNYTLRIDIVKLMNSIDSKNIKEINREIINRCNNIKMILEKNGINLISFFEDIKNQNILYKKIDDITDNDILLMLQEINLCVEDKFNKLFDFVKNNNGILPNKRSKNHEEKMLAIFVKNLKRIDGLYNNTILTKERLMLLHDSEYESLKNIYKIILYKSIENNQMIAYINNEMKNNIVAYLNELKECKTLEEKVKVNLKHKDARIDSEQFYDFVNFVICNNGVLPSNSPTKSDEEKRLGNYRNTIQCFYMDRKYTILTKEQLEYLHNSKYESLREIYKNILFKAISNNINLDYVDIEMELKIREYLEKKENSSTIEEMAELNNIYKDYIIIESQFDEFINFVLNNNGILPNKRSSDEKEKALGVFRGSFKQVHKTHSPFRPKLSKKQLEYMYNSSYKSLNDIYDEIMEKAYSIQYQDYINIDLELKKEKKGIGL